MGYTKLSRRVSDRLSLYSSKWHILFHIAPFRINSRITIILWNFLSIREQPTNCVLLRMFYIYIESILLSHTFSHSYAL